MFISTTDKIRVKLAKRFENNGIIWFMRRDIQLDIANKIWFNIQGKIAWSL